jgi:hypothetical protein
LGSEETIRAFVARSAVAHFSDGQLSFPGGLLASIAPIAFHYCNERNHLAAVVSDKIPIFLLVTSHHPV